MTPYNPMEASRTARNPKKPDSVAISRSRRSESAISDVKRVKVERHGRVNGSHFALDSGDLGGNRDLRPAQDYGAGFVACAI